MKYATNDNDDPWCSLAAVTERLLGKKCDRREEHREGDQQAEKNPKAKNEYVEHRLRELAAFEQRARGGGPVRRMKK